MNVSEIINAALLNIAQSSELSIFLAQGIQDPNGVFGTLNNLKDVISDDRLIEMPVAEACGIGSAVGAAINGLRPIVSFHRVEFVLPALEQILNNAAKANFISGGAYSAPLLIRAVIGRGWGQGPCHSQSFENIFAATPGLKVIFPSLPRTAYKMIQSAYYDDAPTMCLEHRWVHFAEGEYDDKIDKNYEIQPISVAEGDALTIVTYSYMTFEALMVVDYFRKNGIKVDLIDLQSIRPLKLERVFDSVKKTGRVLIVDQGHMHFGVSGEIYSQIIEQCFNDLEIAPIRIGLPDLPSPSSLELIKDYYVTAIDIAEAAVKLLPKNIILGDALESIIAARNANQLDVPNEKFRGPF